jgi:hypothetical protein
MSPNLTTASACFYDYYLFKQELKYEDRKVLISRLGASASHL